MILKFIIATIKGIVKAEKEYKKSPVVLIYSDIENANMSFETSWFISYSQLVDLWHFYYLHF